MRVTETLRCQPQPFLQMPVDIWLEDDMLRWRVGPSDPLCLQYAEEATEEASKGAPEYSGFAIRPVTGSLDDFTVLADAGPEGVLAFARARGVLAIDPLVTPVRGARAFDAEPIPTYDYAETVASYLEMASHFRRVVEIMAAVKSGDIRKEDLRRWARGMWEVPDDFRTSPSDMHREVWSDVEKCWDFAEITILPAVFGRGPRASVGKGRPFSFAHDVAVWFGDWIDGFQWDHGAARRTRPGAMVTAPDYYVRPEAQGYRESHDEWVMPYREYIAQTNYEPHQDSRPSALYNSLMFQLLKIVTLKENQYACSNATCKKGVYTYDPERARKPVGQENHDDWGNSQPRVDRQTSFCSESCRDSYEAADKREGRALKARARKMAKVAGSPWSEKAPAP